MHALNAPALNAPATLTPASALASGIDAREAFRNAFFADPERVRHAPRPSVPAQLASAPPGALRRAVTLIARLFALLSPSALYASLDPSRSAALRKPHSHVSHVVRGPDGCVKKRAPWQRNTTTDTAVGYTNRRDWQAAAFGGGVPTFAATMTGFATSVTGTSLTNTGAAFPTTGNGLAGMIVAAAPNNAGVGSTVFGVIMSNSGTVLTIDQWYSAGSPGGAAGTTPNGTCAYQVLPGQMPAMWIAVTEDNTAASQADVTLAGELAVDGFSRAMGTWAHTHAATTYTLIKTFTATGTRTINKVAVFGSAVKDKGVMPFESAEPSPPTLVSGDTLQQTVTITIN